MRGNRDLARAQQQISNTSFSFIIMKAAAAAKQKRKRVKKLRGPKEIEVCVGII